MTRSNVPQRLQLTVEGAARKHPALIDRAVTPHVIRHTTAMHLLQSGVDITVIALWLGHEDTATTHMYVEADAEGLTLPADNRAKYSLIAIVADASECVLGTDNGKDFSGHQMGNPIRATV